MLREADNLITSSTDEHELCHKSRTQLADDNSEPAYSRRSRGDISRFVFKTRQRFCHLCIYSSELLGLGEHAVGLLHGQHFCRPQHLHKL